MHPRFAQRYKHFLKLCLIIILNTARALLISAAYDAVASR